MTKSSQNQPSSSNWMLVSCVPNSEFAVLILPTAQGNGIDPSLVFRPFIVERGKDVMSCYEGYEARTYPIMIDNQCVFISTK